MADDPRKILVIEDDTLLRSMMQKGLERAGYEAVVAVNGTQGIELFKQHKPSLVITDMLMPDKEGMQTIMELKQIDPDIKIIAMSGGGSTKNMAFLEMSKRVGAVATISKPFKPQDLFDLIGTLL